MQNFGRGMWRRIGDFEKNQAPKLNQQEYYQQQYYKQQYYNQMLEQQIIEQQRLVELERKKQLSSLHFKSTNKTDIIKEANDDKSEINIINTELMTEEVIPIVIDEFKTIIDENITENGLTTEEVINAEEKELKIEEEIPNIIHGNITENHHNSTENEKEFTVVEEQLVVDESSIVSPKKTKKKSKNKKKK